jgi:CMP-2-keto-3-deoxyoctulosonic acid synthetase
MPADWKGPPRPDASGNVAVDGFNDFLSDHPEFARSPVRATIEFVRLKDPRALNTRVGAEAEQLENPDDVRVVLTEDGIGDDSVAAVRYALQFSRAGNKWRLDSARRTQKCQPGRGHQQFSPQPCQ